MTQCIGVKGDGQLCRGIAARGSDYCPAHDPSRKEARKRSASKAARAKNAHREVGEVKLELSELIRQVRDEEVPRGVGAVCSQLYNTLLRAVELQMKIRDHEEYEKRLAELERLMSDGEQMYGTS
jgi:hypothetical protein